ncbi:hypothetical protein [Mesorhizobium sp. WSM2239]|uniref:Uncharacterized protein n=2 Tax=unclassified Mesorhizobium TaxID=325217 RepID=A0AAU8DEU3_9HYPH
MNMQTMMPADPAARLDAKSSWAERLRISHAEFCNNNIAVQHSLPIELVACGTKIAAGFLFFSGRRPADGDDSFFRKASLAAAISAFWAWFWAEKRSTRGPASIISR